ncbi:hypothetical protein JG687_00006442 [Phytophthora cactorum]|uniref:Uncharacterized protein n=1 Tax=Phytophthora cactorum TaxID=29920 RepID=A0A8T1CZP8_9STRA|nr:hypothetical protein Pcac1_g8724 [Phytophthora cactorum]KAG2818618.1 hypothetical protein PC112_g12552 [Phytophthora cactorum]KAG2820718.1 hypothetical protein PC111_g11338 [Phytophthora cactorum]KAG2854751.1 hypothetical protein PC113_g13036 [Phytophthora cactorum]KAG2900342.1 hypothetical protein PC114_g13609 [Phytophthora cactorum]
MEKATTSCTVLLALRCVSHLFLCRCRSEAQPADTSSQVDSRASPDQDSSKRDGSSSQSDSPAMKTRLQEFEPTCKMQLEDVNVVDVPASTTVAKKPKLIEWLEKFEAQHLKELKGVGPSDGQVMAAASPQISRLAAWLAAFEAKHDGLESGQPR